MCSAAVPFKYIKPAWHKTKQQATGVCTGCELLDLAVIVVNVCVACVVCTNTVTSL